MIPAFVLVLIAMIYRIAAGILVESGSATWLSNFAPFAAIALCGAVFFPAKYKFSVPLLALLLSDIVLNFYYSVPLLHPLIVGRYFALGVVGCLGLLLQRKRSLKVLLPASVAGSIVFYVITNAFSWVSDPGYTKSLAGLVQALTVGLPAYSGTPTWMFFRNSLLSDFVFTGLFVLCVHFGKSLQPSRADSALARAA